MPGRELQLAIMGKKKAMSALTVWKQVKMLLSFPLDQPVHSDSSFNRTNNSNDVHLMASFSISLSRRKIRDLRCSSLHFNPAMQPWTCYFSGLLSILFIEPYDIFCLTFIRDVGSLQLEFNLFSIQDLIGCSEPKSWLPASLYDNSFKVLM